MFNSIKVCVADVVCYDGQLHGLKTYLRYLHSLNLSHLFLPQLMVSTLPRMPFIRPQCADLKPDVGCELHVSQMSAQKLVRLRSSVF